MVDSYQSQILQEAARLTDLSALSNDTYELLNLQIPFSRNELKKAYHDMALKYHPDKQYHCSDETILKHQQIFLKIKDIFDINDLLFDYLNIEDHNMKINLFDKFTYIKYITGKPIYYVILAIYYCWEPCIYGALLFGVVKLIKWIA